MGSFVRFFMGTSKSQNERDEPPAAGAKKFRPPFQKWQGGRVPTVLPLRGRRARHKKRQQNLGTYVPQKAYTCYGGAKPRTPAKTVGRSPTPGQLSFAESWAKNLPSRLGPLSAARVDPSVSSRARDKPMDKVFAYRKACGGHAALRGTIQCPPSPSRRRAFCTAR